uniref:Uncharacterized protein n=1 Tax=Rousettus aegyptiacus TaxID=9407 RepID=A0A7J8C2A8_ROUAE|nr:hypothetical protein HJG63_009317 [Rousettus aegyptiacus]
MVILYLIFGGTATLFSTAAALFCISTGSHKVSSFSASLLTCHFLVCFFYNSHPNGCAVVSHCGFDFHFPNIGDVGHFFMSLLAICISSLEKCLFKSLAHFKKNLLLLLLSSRCSFIYSGY